jgi:hypothetical protein
MLLHLGQKDRMVIPSNAKRSDDEGKVRRRLERHGTFVIIGHYPEETTLSNAKQVGPIGYELVEAASHTMDSLDIVVHLYDYLIVIKVLGYKVTLMHETRNTYNNVSI